MDKIRLAVLSLQDKFFPLLFLQLNPFVPLILLLSGVSYFWDHEFDSFINKQNYPKFKCCSERVNLKII